jgi:hypothetical protein
MLRIKGGFAQGRTPALGAIFRPWLRHPLQSPLNPSCPGYFFYLLLQALWFNPRHCEESAQPLDEAIS